METIIEKTNHCLNCKIKPCSIKGCPLGNNIPAFIQEVKQNNLKKAYEILSETTVLPGVCGRICPHEKQCQGSCIRGIKSTPVSIGELEAYVFDEAMKRGEGLPFEIKKLEESKNKNNKTEKNKVKKVAIVGGGPAGLTCAAFLAKEGVYVTIYEKYNYLGGLLMHGIPEFRLPKEIVNKTVESILNLGIEVKYNQELGKNLSLEELEKQYDAIFLSIGANKSAKMGVEGEELQGIFGGNELLEQKSHPNYEGKIVSVIGGGNVAMDCARTIKRLGAKEVNVIYRRAEEQMPAERKEIEDAKKEGIKFLFQNNIVKILGQDPKQRNGQIDKNIKEEQKEINQTHQEKTIQHVEETEVTGLELIKTQLIKKEGETREVPVNIEGSNYNIKTDYIVMALGGMVSNEVLELGLTLNKWGNILINENYQTSNSQIYAGGDLAGIKGTVAWAAKSGREAAKSILQNI